MKLKTGFVLHSIGDEYIVVPVNERTKEFKGMIRLNSSGAYLWENMQTDFTNETLVSALLNRYEVSEQEASQTVESFVKSLIDGKVIEQ